MSNFITGANSGNPLTVDAMIRDPKYIPNQIRENLDGAFIEAALFRDAGPNDGVVAYGEAVAAFTSEDAEIVAEFGEIPVAEIQAGKQKTVIGSKIAQSVGISLEQRKMNRIDPVNQGVTALQNTMTRTSVRASLEAFNKAEVPTLTVGTPWDSADANPLKDIRSGKRLVSQAKDQNGNLFGYRADTLLIAESTLEAALDHENAQKFYVGNMAVENPSFLGITPQMLSQLRIVTSSWLEEDEIYLLEAGTAGFYSDTLEMTITDLYSPGGDNGYGGPTQSWRVDAFRNRIIAIDAPQSVVKIEGALG